MSNIFQIEKQLNSGEKSLEEISQYLPSFLHINNLESIELDHVDMHFPRSLGLSEEGLGDQKLSDLVHQVDLASSIQAIRGYLMNLDSQNYLQYFQRIFLESQNYKETLFTTTRVINKSQLLGISIPVGKIEIFNKKISSLFSESDFIKRNSSLFNRLSPKEIEVSSLLAKGYSLQEIESLIEISQNTLKKHRKNIYSKLGVSNYYEFYRFAKIFKLDI